MLSWLRQLLIQKTHTALLDDHVESEAIASKRAFPSADGPYRTTVRFLEHQQVTEEELYQAECRIQEWLFRRFEAQDSTYVVACDPIEIQPEKEGTITVTAQRTFKVCRMVLFSKQLDMCQVMTFTIGVERQGEFWSGGVNATLYRLLTFDPVQFSAMFLVGHSASIIIKNKSTEPISISGAFLGHRLPEPGDDRASILARVRSRKLVVSLLRDDEEQ